MSFQDGVFQEPFQYLTLDGEVWKRLMNGDSKILTKYIKDHAPDWRIIIDKDNKRENGLILRVFPSHRSDLYAVPFSMHRISQCSFVCISNRKNVFVIL